MSDGPNHAFPPPDASDGNGPSRDGSETVLIRVFGSHDKPLRAPLTWVNKEKTA